MVPKAYGQTPIFDEFSLPDALRADHRTKAGTWGLLSVLEGKVKLIFTDPYKEILVTVNNPAPIPPQVPHHVETEGPMRMKVEFFKEHPLLVTDDE